MGTSLANSNISMANNLEGILNQAIEIMDRLGSGFTSFREKLAALQGRLGEGRFHLAVLGQFKRGKSTLLNALMGEPLLPTAVVPLTAIPTFIRYDHSKHAKVSFLNQQPAQECFSEDPQELNSFLAKYVSEEENPQNRLRVAFTELFIAADILKQGVVLIDTPGIGSTYRHNTETTLNFLQQCDAALFLLSADPPITEAELDFLKEALPKIGKIFMALNKTDYLSAAEKEALVNFLRKVFAEKLDTGLDLSILTISARQGLEAKLSGDLGLWENSGLKELNDHLINFLVAEKNVILKAAVMAKTSALLADSAMQIGLCIQSLELPLNQLEERLEIFKDKLKEAETEKQFARDILNGDRKRLLELLEEQAKDLRLKAQAHFEGIIQQSEDNLGQIGENEVRKALSTSIPAFFEHELAAMSQLFDTRVSGLLQFHQYKANDLIEAVRSAAAEIFEIPYHPGERTRYFELNPEPYWVTHQWDDSLSPIPPEWIDRLLPRRIRENRIHRRLLRLIHLLIQRNVENLRWATLQNLDNTFRRFTVEFDQRLQDTINATQGAIKTTILKRSEQVDKISEEIMLLKKSATELSNLQDLLKS
jgi:GTP-binding protein EngB required for normal cell division